VLIVLLDALFPGRGDEMICAAIIVFADSTSLSPISVASYTCIAEAGVNPELFAGMKGRRQRRYSGVAQG